MILPLALSVVLSIDKSMMIVNSHSEKYWQIKETNTSLDHYQFTTKDINPKPYDYIRSKTSTILYDKIAEELLQDEEDKK